MSQALGGDSPNAQQAPGAGAPATRKARAKAEAKAPRKARARTAAPDAETVSTEPPVAPAKRKAKAKRKASAKRKNAAAAPRATPITTTAPGRWTFGMAVSYLEGVAATLITSHQLKGSIQIVGKIAA